MKPAWAPTAEQIAKVHALLRPRVTYLPPVRKAPAAKRRAA